MSETTTLKQMMDRITRRSFAESGEDVTFRVDRHHFTNLCGREGVWIHLVNMQAGEHKRRDLPVLVETEELLKELLGNCEYVVNYYVLRATIREGLMNSEPLALTVDIREGE